MEKTQNNYIVWLEQIHLKDIDIVGTKTAFLGEIFNNLSPQRIRIPNGFAITAEAYQDHLEAHKLKEPLKDLFSELSIASEEDLKQKAYWARQLILSAPLPTALQNSITFAYHVLSEQYGEFSTDVAVRSSGTAKDLPGISFYRQQETYLNIKGEHQLLDACRKCFASLFTEKAILYRNKFGYDQMKVSLSVCVQKMVRADMAGAGCTFSIEPDVVLINASYGLGEHVVQGTVRPDEYYVFKSKSNESSVPLLRKEPGTKEFKLAYDTNGEKLVKVVSVPSEDRVKFVLSDDEALELSRWTDLIKDYLERKEGRKISLETEWAKDGKDGKLYLLQVIPEGGNNG